MAFDVNQLITDPRLKKKVKFEKTSFQYWIENKIKFFILTSKGSILAGEHVERASGSFPGTAHSVGQTSWEYALGVSVRGRGF